MTKILFTLTSFIIASAVVDAAPSRGLPKKSDASASTELAKTGGIEGSTLPTDTLILSGKIIAKNQHLFAIKPRQGKPIKIPVNLLQGRYTKASKGDAVTVEVPLATYERFNSKKK